MLHFLEIFGLAVLINWGVPIVGSALFFGWLRYVSGDVVFEERIWLFGRIPVIVLRLVSTRSWYAKRWKRYYGQAGFLVFIFRRDHVGDHLREQATYVHEMRHVQLLFVMGSLMWILYGVHYLFLLTCTLDDPYVCNWFEMDARRAVDRWIKKGSLPLFEMSHRS